MATSSSLLLKSLSSLRLSTPPPPPSSSQTTISQNPLISLSLSPSPPSISAGISHSVKSNQSVTPLIPKDTDYSPPSDLLSVLCPSLAYSNKLFFKSAYNLQVIVGENEPEEKLIGRFRREVFRAGIIQECKRRRYFETNQEKRKRKRRDAARRNRKRRPMVKTPQQDMQETPKKKVKEEEDNWDSIDVDLPYCGPQLKQ